MIQATMSTGVEQTQVAPDHGGGSLVNLTSSLVAARGGHTAHPHLELLPPERLVESTNVILLVIDGLGDDWLAATSPHGILAQHRLGAITSVFPSTTAAAIPTFLTGEPPLRHGLTGWHTYLGELGAVMTVLPGTPRCGGVSYRQAGIDPGILFTCAPVFDRIADRSILVSPESIARSDFNLAHQGRADLYAYRGLHDLFRLTSRLLHAWGRRRHERKYLHLYWPRLDAIGHMQGIWSEAARTHLLQIEAAIARFMDEIADTDSRLVVTADHGQIDTTPEDVIDLADHPRLAETLLLPLCGEPRAAFCYVRSGREDAFLDYCQAHLTERIELTPSKRLREAGLFGTGPAHPRFDERIGDYCIRPKGAGVIRQWLPCDEPHRQIGVHGGSSQAEMRVPLCLL